MKSRIAAMAMAVAGGVQAQTAVKRIYAVGTPVASQRFAAAIWAGECGVGDGEEVTLFPQRLKLHVSLG